MFVQRVSRIGRRYRHFHRYREVASVLLKHGFGDLVRRLGLHRYLRLWRYRSGEHGTEYIPTSCERVRLALEELGPAFVKLGQVLSTRRDIVPAKLILELEKLQDAVPPFPAAEARKIIETDLKCSIAELFTTFRDEPLASASIAQVHEAVTRTGERVVVKVRRPRIETTIETDLEIMASIAELLERLLPESAVFEPVRLVQEFAKIIRREMDFSTEAAHLERFARNFAGDKRIHVPAVHRAMVTERVLAMEYIDGIKISRGNEFAAHGLDREEVARRGAQLVLEQVFIHGFFHADPHPGNVLILPGNVYCFLDYGMMGMLTSRQRELLSDLIIGLAARDERRIVQAIFQLSRFTHRERTVEVEADIFSFCETHLYKPLKEIRVGTVLNEMTRILIRYDLHLPPEFFTLSKAISTMEGVGTSLSPEFDIMAAAEPFAQRLLRERMNPRRVLRQVGSTLVQVQGFLRDVPAELADLFAQLKRGDVRMKVEHRGLENLTHVLDQVSNRISFAIVLAALLVGSALMVHSGIPPKWHGLPVIGVLGFSFSGVMGFSLLYSILKHGKM